MKDVFDEVYGVDVGGVVGLLGRMEVGEKEV